MPSIPVENPLLIQQFVQVSRVIFRRLINAMDDVTISNDKYRSVRNTANRIIQFTYGEDE